MLARARYCAYMLGRAYDDEAYLQNVWWSDECHVLLSGHVNKQNLCFLGWQKPDEYAQIPLHSEKVTVWCAQSAHGIIGPCFLEDINGRSVTVTSQVYRDQVIDRFLADLQTICEVKGLDYERQVFQQDGATSHTGRGNLGYLMEHLPNELISRFADTTYPPRSPDLTPCDSFLWGHLKENSFRNPIPWTAGELKMNIENVLSGISDDTLMAMIENIRQRMDPVL